MQPEQLKLVVVAGPKPCGPFHSHPEHHRPVTVGRAEGNDICLPSDCVSRRHCRLYTGGGRWFVRDLGSGNGTHVNNVRISTSREIKDADRLKVGDFEFQVHLQRSSASTGQRVSPPGPPAKVMRTFMPMGFHKSLAPLRTF